MRAGNTKSKIDCTRADSYLPGSLSAFICSPRDTPKGPRGVILFTPLPPYAC
jgi:hypothetical protein